MDTKKFNREKEQLLKQAENLVDVTDAARVEKTAETLEGYSYAPTLLWPINNFVRMDKQKLLRVMREAAEVDDDELIKYGFDPSGDLQEKRLVQMRTLLNHYRDLLGLRRGDLDAWDQFNELYEDD
jgi:hypothetical protein